MSAQPFESPRPATIERTPKAVLAALPPQRAAEFKRDWNTALDKAREDMDLAPLQEVVDSYWGVASAAASPNAAEATEQARRFVAGHDIGVVPASEVFARLR
jgi:Family of unknown function (DUF6247)